MKQRCLKGREERQKGREEKSGHWWINRACYKEEARAIERISKILFVLNGKRMRILLVPQSTQAHMLHVATVVEPVEWWSLWLLNYKCSALSPQGWMGCDVVAWGEGAQRLWCNSNIFGGGWNGDIFGFGESCAGKYNRLFSGTFDKAA